MKMCASNVNSNHKYSFPFEAYDIQTQFMDQLYDCLDNSKIGIFESPTGTGKSLSIICATITWMRDHKAKVKRQLNERLTHLCESIHKIETQLNTSCDWISLQKDKMSLCEERDRIKKQMIEYEDYEKRNDELKLRKAKIIGKKNFGYKSAAKKLKVEECDDLKGDVNDDDDDIVTYDSGDDDADLIEKKSDDKLVKPKVFYMSRTHSQLSQFINEIKRTVFANTEEPLRVVTLGSRGNLCINPGVTKLGAVNLINDRCLELQNQKSAKNKCQMHKQMIMHEFKDVLLSDVHDIEEVVNSGRQLKGCPYYSTRFAIPEAEIVVLPYNILLHDATRKSYGIDLSESIVIIDEAHNLCETINAIHSVEMKGSIIIDAHFHLCEYLTKYHKRLNPKNLMNIKQIIYILKEFIKYLNKITANQTCNVIDFLIELRIENLNIHKVIEYCEKSQIARKLFGFSKRQTNVVLVNKCNDSNEMTISGTSAFLAKMKDKSKAKAKQNVKHINQEHVNAENTSNVISNGSLYEIIDFLKSLINPSADGRIIISKNSISIRNSSIKYVLLSPSALFKKIIDESRSIILAGGTMKPFAEFTDLLFEPLGVEEKRIHIFSCGHVIPESNLLTIALGEGPCGTKLNYTFQNRNSTKMIEETGRVISNVCNIINGGIVCFFPSYEYENFLYTHWEKCGILKVIESKNKRIFREPKKANELAMTLADYARTVRLVSDNNRGAVLFSIVGGKMSEGINFSDDLGRCVIMIGLPYANQNSSELQMRINYLNKIKQNAGAEYYENLCMRAVNQSIGRSIRHKNDYSVIVLLDERYTNRQNIQNNLPQWIGARLKICNKFSPAFKDIRDFFINCK